MPRKERLMNNVSRCPTLENQKLIIGRAFVIGGSTSREPPSKAASRLEWAKFSAVLAGCSRKVAIEIITSNMTLK
jgi:hypothetical protein